MNIGYHELKCVVNLIILEKMCIAKYTKRSTNFLTRQENTWVGLYLNRLLSAQ